MPTLPSESTAYAVKVATPLAVGVPLMTPLLDSVSPAGKALALIEKVYGPVPPLAVTV